MAAYKEAALGLNLAEKALIAVMNISIIKRGINTFDDLVKKLKMDKKKTAHILEQVNGKLDSEHKNALVQLYLDDYSKPKRTLFKTQGAQ